MDSVTEPWFSSLVLHLQLHLNNLTNEKRPQEHESIAQQSTSLQRCLDRFRVGQCGVLIPPQGEHHPTELFGKINELFDGQQHLSPSELWHELTREVSVLHTSLVAVLVQTKAPVQQAG